MENPVIKLHKLATQKRKACAELFTLYNVQTELEVDLILIQLDFRYDNEANWLEYEKNLDVYNLLLRENHANITKIISEIEFYSFQMINL